jgi:uncharacterized membrane protein
MFDFIYEILTQFGYTHPLHPTITHLPIGMTMGAILFLLGAFIFRNSGLDQTARHCLILAFIGAVPTALSGFLDWQHFYAGALLFPIKMKLALAGILIFFLVLAMIFGFFGKFFSNILVSLYLLCLICVIGLGYFGGELVYETKAPVTEISEGSPADGAMVFNQNCSVCHLTDSTATKIGPGLKGVFNADAFPVSGWSVSDENFRKQLKTPFDKMPPFGHLQPDQVEVLMAYLKTL